MIHTISNSEQQVFSEIYVKYFQPLCIYAYRFFPDKDDAAEIVQDVMTKLWEKKETLSRVESIQSYLYRSVYNHCLNKLEHLKVHTKYTDYQRIRLLEIELEDFEETFPIDDFGLALQKEIEALPSKAKLVFEKRFVENKRYKEIAEELNISERTVESHIQSSVKTLREKLRKFILIGSVVLAAWLSYCCR